jgi:hypothetical protein
MPTLKLSEPTADLAQTPAIQRWVLITWPAFLAACLLEALVFSMVDPGEVHWLGHQLEASRQAVYTAAFFCFWLIAMASNGLVLWLHKPAQSINHPIAD